MEESNHKDVNLIPAGKHEVNIRGRSEADLHDHCQCEKNPSHDKFIPVKKFTINNISPPYQDITMFELILGISALTVLVEVMFTSNKRPESASCFKGEYPFYSVKEKIKRTGTGRIIEVIRNIASNNTGSCPCRKCKHSDAPNKEWWEVRVETATHVVFDNTEAKQTSCTVDFDENKCSGQKIYGWKVLSADVDGDFCLLICVTCNKDLLEDLENRCKRLKDHRDEINTNGNFVVVVSHPHGCSKQISVGQWLKSIDREEDDSVYTKFTYTASTCPGSSGAPVFKLEPGKLYGSFHPHSGCTEQISYSAEVFYMLF